MSALPRDVLAVALPGEALQRAREASGLSLEQVSARIVFSVSQLRALEAGHWDALPRGLPLRGMVKAYAKCLDLPEQPLLAGLAGAERPGVGLARAFSSASPLVEVERGTGSGVWLLALAVIAAAAAFLAYWQGWLVFD